MKQKKGFTLIELMVSIAIIALLTAGISFSISKYRLYAEARAFVEELEQLDTAFTTYVHFELDGVWPMTVSGIDIDDLVDGTWAPLADFSDYYSDKPDVLNDYEVSYYFTSDSYTPCPSQGDSGVNIQVTPQANNKEKFEQIFEMINKWTDGDAITSTCGTVRLYGTNDSLYYLIAENGSSY